jgi:hypothetical protein
MIPKYTEDPKQEPKNGWFCENCGRRLPVYGVWQWRYQKYLAKVDQTLIRTVSGYYCDPCADARESGADF